VDALIRSVTSELGNTSYPGTTPERQFARVELATTEEREVGGPQHAQVLRTIVDNPVYDTTYGFVTSATRTVTQAGVGDWVTTTNFDPEVIDGTGQWCLGVPGTVVISNLIPGGAPLTRTVDHVYTRASVGPTP
jgi:hypothetical protein